MQMLLKYLKYKAIIIVTLILISSTNIFAQINIAAGNTITENFDAIGVTATATLPVSWKVGKQIIDSIGVFSAAGNLTNYRGGDNSTSITNNGIYNFGSGPASTAPDRAVGFLSSTTATKSGNLYTSLSNNGGTNITNFIISYDVEKYRNGTNAFGFIMQLYYSMDGISWISGGSNFLTSFAGNDPNSTGFSVAPGDTVIVSGIELDLNSPLAPGATIYLAWHYSVTPLGPLPSATQNSTANAQALAIDNVTITASNSCIVPTLSANQIVISNVLSSSMTLNWTNGNGNGRIIVISTSNSFTIPDNGTEYIANSVYGGSNEQVVFNNTIGNTVTVTGLNPGTTYYFKVFEYNCNGVNIKYNFTDAANNPNNSTTLCITPTIQANQFTFSNIFAHSITANWTNGNGMSRIVKINTINSFTNLVDGASYTASSVYSGSGEQIIYNGSLSSVNVTGLSPTSSYYFRVYEYNCSGTNALYNTTTATDNPKTQATVGFCVTPTVQASNLIYSYITTSSMKLTWTNGNADYRIVVAREGNPVTAIPANGIAYNAGAIFGSGSEIATGEFVIYAGEENSVVLTGLSMNTMYHFAIYEYCAAGGSGTELYKTPGYAGSNSTYGNNPATPFEIESILVQACCINTVSSLKEGLNEMVRFRVGPNPINVNDLHATWANTYLLWYGVTTNPQKTDSLNQTIPVSNVCGKLLEPVGGILPPFAKVMLISSKNLEVGSNSFASLMDTVYIIYHNSTALSGHFANFSSTSDLRTFTMWLGSPVTYTDSVQYNRSLLFDGKGSTVNYDFWGTPVYTNPGCNAPYQPPTAGISIAANPSSTVCTGNSIVFTATPYYGGTAPVYEWKKNGITVGTNSTVYAPASLVNGDIITCSITSDRLCLASNVGTSNAIAVTINTLPNIQTQPISQAICQGNNTSFSLTASGTAITYQWKYSSDNGVSWNNVPNNAPYSGVNLSTLSITSATNSLNGYLYKCYVSGTCTPSLTSSSAILTINPLPDAAGAISGTTPVCQGLNGVTYSIPAISNATQYFWLIPTGASISSGSNTNSIVVNYSNTAVSGNISVYGANSCGVGTTSANFAITVNPLPGVAGLISGSATVCQGQNTVSFSIPAISNSTSYTWAYSGTGATISGTTSSMTINFSSTATSGNLTVSGTNACGNGTSSVNYTITVNPLPVSAGAITGLATVCQSQNGVSYSVPAITNANGYFWSLPTGASIATGSNTNNVTVNFSNTASSGNIVVNGTNACGSGVSSTSYPVTVNPLPVITSAVKTDVSLCGGNDGTITINATGASPLEYSINGGTDFSMNAGVFSGLIAGNYTIVVKNSLGCSITGATLVINNGTAPPPPVAGTDSIYCQGETIINLTATAGNGGIIEWWSNSICTNLINTGSSCTPGNTVGVTNYYATETLAGCKSTPSTVSITINAKPVATATPSSQILCSGGTTGISLSSVPPASGFNWTIVQTGVTGASVGSGNNIIQTLTNSLSVPGSCTYSIVPTANNCDGNAVDVMITVNPIPDVIFNPISSVICSNSATNISLTSSVSGTSFLWTVSQNGVTGATSGSGTNISQVLNYGAAPATATYSVIPSANNCTGTSTIIVVNVNSLPVITNTYSGTNCGAGFVSLGASSSGVINWYNVPTGVVSLATGTMYSPSVSVTTTFYVDATLSNCTSSSRTAIIATIYPIPTAFAGNDFSIPNGTSTTLNGSANGGSGNYTYSWVPAGNLVNATVQNPNTINLTNTTTFTLTVTDALTQCQGTDQVIVTISGNVLNVILSANPVTICKGGNTQLNALASGGSMTYTYSWSPSTGLTNTSISNPEASPSSTIAYTVTVNDGFTSVVGNLTLIVHPNPVITIDSTNISCFGKNDGSITATANSGTAPYNFIWGNGLGSNAHITGLAPNVFYYLTVTDAFTCSSKDSVKLSQPLELTASINASLAKCSGGTGAILNTQISGGSSPYIYMWQNGTTASSIQDLNGGNYNLKVTDNNGCIDRDSITIPIALKLTYDSAQSTTSCIGNNDANLFIAITGGTSPFVYSWSNQESTEDIINLTKGMYKLTITDSENCISIFTFDVLSSSNTCLEIPSAFTPNADGKNDKWVIKNIHLYPKATLEIFNRWGEVIFKPGNMNESWDGTYKGTEASAGSYIYIINLNDNSGTEPLNGVVTIIR